MVARVEDCFLGKEQGFGGHRLLGPGPWGGRWSHGGGGGGGRDVGDAAMHGGACSFYAASKSGDLPMWTSHQHQVQHALQLGGGGGGCKALLHHNGGHSHGSCEQQQPGVRLNASVAVPESVTVTTASDGIMTSFVSSYLMSRSAQAASAAVAAQPGRANCLAPGGGASLARNPSFESTTSGSCSTPSFCVGSPATVFPSRPCDSGSKDSVTSDHQQQLLLPGGVGGLVVGGGPYSELKGSQPSQHQPQLSDHYNLSTDSLSYGSLEGRDAIVNCVGDFWSNPSHMVDEPLLPDMLRFEPMLDDTAMSFSGVGELDSLVATATTHGPPAHRSTVRGSLPAQDFCQLFFVGDHDGGEKAPGFALGKPAQLAIPSKASLNANPGSDHNNHGGRLRWSDQPWAGAATAATPHGPLAEIKSPTSLAGSSPSSPTTPLDPHLFATQTPSATLSEDEIRKKLTEFSTAGSMSKRSFATMSGELDAPITTAPTLRGAGPNTDKFDAAALSTLLYNTTQTNPEFRSAHTTNSTGPPAPKQRRRHGTATDPQSIAARTRREKFTDRIRVLQSLVPNGERLDTVHMLSQTFEYVRFLQHKVWDLYNGQDSLSELKCEKWKEFVDSATGQVIV